MRAQKDKQKCLVKLNDRQTDPNRQDLPKGSERSVRGRHSTAKGVCLPEVSEDEAAPKRNRQGKDKNGKQHFIKADELAKELNISQGLAYKMIAQWNEELKAKGYTTVGGRVSRRYYQEKIYGAGEE